jgi:hypothetical protein
MGLPQVQDSNIAVTTPPTAEQIVNTTVTAYINVHRITNAKIIGCMPGCVGNRPRYILMLLMAVKAYNGCTRKRIMTDLGYSGHSVLRGFKYLYENGYISQVGMARLIKPFQRYIVDKGYVITEAGEMVLRAIICGK